MAAKKIFPVLMDEDQRVKAQEKAKEAKQSLGAIIRGLVDKWLGGPSNEA